MYLARRKLYGKVACSSLRSHFRTSTRQSLRSVRPRPLMSGLCSRNPHNILMNVANAHTRQIRTPAIPPKRLPIRHRLPVHPKRGRRLEARDKHQGDPSRHPITSRRAQPRVPSASRRIQPVQERQGCVRAKGQADRQGKPSAVVCQ